jgi:CheY-like chemotaxis protein
MMKILIAEDDENDFLLLQWALRQIKAPVSVERVRDGQEAIEYLANLASEEEGDRSLFPGLILTDINMPRASGFDVIRWIRSNPKLKETPVVVLSSSTRTTDVSLANELGANSFLIKEASLDRLTNQMDSMLCRWGSRCEKPYLANEDSAIELGVTGGVSPDPPKPSG